MVVRFAISLSLWWFLQVTTLSGSPVSDYQCVTGPVLNESSGVIRSSSIRLVDENDQEVSIAAGSNYPSNAFCMWEFDMPAGKFITFKFRRLQMELSNNCDGDRVEIYTLFEDYERYCGFGDPMPAPLTYSTDAPFWVNLITDETLEYPGFEIEYEVTENDPCDEKDNFRCLNRNCVPSGTKCDKNDDCGDGSDEADCPYKTDSSGKCGTPAIVPEEGNDGDRIVGGKVVIPGSWPWQVSLQNSFSFPSGHFCGGSLINDQWILTAAHCLQAVALGQLKVVLGSHNRYVKDNGEFSRYASIKCTHKDYNNFRLENDIGLIKLNAPVKMSDYIQPICLPAPGEELVPGTLPHITGWGRTLGSGGHQYLKQVQLPVLNATTCSSMPTPIPLTANNICLGATTGHSAPCFGDSGGPLVSKSGKQWQLFGLVSWGPETCGVDNHPYVMTKVSSYLNWIQHQLQADSNGTKLMCLD